MTSQTVTQPAAASAPLLRRSTLSSPLRVAGAIAQLAALGVVGPIVFTVLLTLLGVGLGLVPVLGIGLVLLLGFVYALYGVGWLETARVDGLYSLGLPGLRTRVRTRPGFGGFLRMVWQQFIDPSMWRAVASAAISTILGLVVLPLISLFASGIVLAFAPLFARGGAVRLAGTGIDVPVAWASVVGVLAAVVAFAAIVGLALLHGVLARVIVVPTR